jgi:hypothetical protein
VPLSFCFLGALPPPRSRFVPLGFFPDDRRSPLRLPARIGDFVFLMFFVLEMEAILVLSILRSSVTICADLFHD